jgi:hypothetical protein
MGCAESRCCVERAGKAQFDFTRYKPIKMLGAGRHTTLLVTDPQEATLVLRVV